MDEPPSPDAVSEVTRLLRSMEDGELQAGDRLLPLVYTELRRLAASRLARLAPGQTLAATELVHEAWMRLVGPTDPGWKGQAHFFGAAARAMRNVLADHLQRKGSLKRGGPLRRVGPDTAAELTCEGPSDDVLAVEEVLQELERQFPRKAEVVTLSFFGGLGHPEIAEVLGLSERTVGREWRFARAWLNQRLTGREDEEAAGWPRGHRRLGSG